MRTRRRVRNPPVKEFAEEMKQWNEQELKYLRASWPAMSDEEIGAKLGRTATAARSSEGSGRNTAPATAARSTSERKTASALRAGQRESASISGSGGRSTKRKWQGDINDILRPGQ